MNPREAGRRGHGAKFPARCSHARLLDDEQAPDGQKTGNLMCLECGAILPDEKGTRFPSCLLVALPWEQQVCCFEPPIPGHSGISNNIR